ncbi:glycosyltransferase [bacterium]|nr:glycosyltransferase [bacterium]
MSKPKICIVTATQLSVHWFLREHLKLMAQWADVTVIFNKKLNVEADISDLPITIKHVHVVRQISLLWDVWSLISLCRLFSLKNYDMVISLTPKAGLLSMLAAKLASVGVRLHIFQGEVWPSKTGLMHILLKAADKAIATLATNLMAVSRSQRSFLEANGIVAEERVKVLGEGSISGVDIDKFKPNLNGRRRERQKHQIPEGALVALFLGRITRDKGVFEMLAAFSVVAKEIDDFWLVLAGPDEEGLTDILYKSVDPDLHARIIFTGFQFAPENLMCAADFLCILSYREGLGLCVLEAAACGVPALGTNISGLSDAIINNETGVLVPLNDHQSAVNAMRELALNEAFRLKLGAAGKARVAVQFDAKSVVKAYDREFFTLI